ncbi:hypothetical protein [Acinetobacter sp.]|uniref:hypothetical protein n=1 Tax=Acinetobacter sp. TaxID=472 RepID=UPI0037501660
MKYVLLALVSSLALAACGGPTVEETDASASTVATDIPSQEPTSTFTGESLPPLDPKVQTTFETALNQATSIEEVWAIHNNLPNSELKNRAAEKLDNMILEELKQVSTHEDAARLSALSMEGSASRLMAKMKMDQYPKKEIPQPSVRPSPSPSPSVRPSESEVQPTPSASANTKQ